MPFVPTSSASKKTGFQIQSINKGGVNLINPEQDQQNEVNLIAETELLKKAPVNQALQDIQSVNEGLLILQDIETAKKKTPTGPAYSNIYDAALRKFNKEGQEEPPGVINFAIQKLSPERVENIRLLNQSVERLFDYIQTKAGKQITSTEKGSVLGQFPGIYEAEKTFNKVLSKSKNNLKELKASKIKFLEDMGYDKESLDKLKANDPKNVGTEVKQGSGIEFLGFEEE